LCGSSGSALTSSTSSAATSSSISRLDSSGTGGISRGGQLVSIKVDVGSSGAGLAAWVLEIAVAEGGSSLIEHVGAAALWVSFNQSLAFLDKSVLGERSSNRG